MYINNNVLDNLGSLASATVRVDICYGTQPAIATYAQATSTASCGSKSSLTMTAITDGATDGRKVSTPAILAGAPGTVSLTETASWWAITDGTSVVHAHGALTATQAVTVSNDFTLDAIDVTIRDAA